VAFYIRYDPCSTFAETVAERKPAAIVSLSLTMRPIVRICIADFGERRRRTICAASEDIFTRVQKIYPYVRYRTDCIHCGVYY